MNPEETRMDPALERAVSEIRGEAVADEVVETAASRVWARLSAAQTATGAGHIPAEHIRSCADFQSLISDFRAGRLPEARALLLQDHLHECVTCRRVYEGRVVAMPQAAPPLPRREVHPMRWAVAAGVILAGGLVVWFSVIQSGRHAGRAMVQAVNGTLYAVSPAGLRVLNTGADLPDDVEIRTARDSEATLTLRDGSTVEMRERSGLSTSQASDGITVHLDRGGVIVQAAKRRSGHFYVATADCRVAVTGTVFSVSSGLKGSRVSVLQGEVRVSHDNQEKVLHRGDQTSTSANLDPVSLNQDFAWSHDTALLGELAKVHSALAQLPLPKPRYSSRLLGLLPASTAFYASIPNLSDYLAQAQGVFRRQAEDSPELQDWLAGPGKTVEPVLEKLRAANEYLGDEIVIFGTPQIHAPVFLAEVKREGLPEFLKQQGLPLASATRPGLVLLSPSAEALGTALDSSFQNTAFYQRISAAYREGAGLLLCADLAHLGPHAAAAGPRYLIAGQKQAGGHPETRASLTFEGPRTGIAAWLAPPSPMGALDYISSEATFVSAFAIKNPGAILEELTSRFHLPAPDGNGAAASLGGELALAMDGPVFPVPSWKVVVEVYDPARFESAVEQTVGQYNRDALAHGGKPLRSSREITDGRTDYVIAASDPNPLMEAHYTFTSGFLIAAPTRALLTQALQVKMTGASVAHAAGFTAMLPRDPYENFSAVIYQNLGNTLAPLVGLLGAFQPPGGGPRPPMPRLDNLKPFLIAAYGEPDRITIASNGDVPGMSLNSFLSGGLFGIATNGLRLGQFAGTSGGRFSSR
jgi:ferric-dicitrate binding protein FerR (iron transport regulator)